MPAGYTDILFGKLALQHQIASPAQLHECLNALEAGQRAGVTQTLSQVLVKRGYLSRQQQRDLDDAVSTAEKGRRAKLVVQLLLRHGRPPEQTLKSYYESLKSHNFPLDLAQALEQYNQITAEERKGLDQAVQRAIPSLCQREAEELALQVEELRKLPPEEVAMRLAAGNTGAGSMSGPMPAAVARATAMRAAYNPDAAQAAQAQAAQAHAAQAQAAQAQAQAQYAAQMQAAHMQYQAQVQYAAQMQAQAQYQAQYQHAQMQQAQLQQAAQLAAAAIMNPAAIMNNPAAAAALGEASQALLRATGMRAAYVPDASTVPAGLAGSPSDTIPAGAPLPEAAASSPGAAPDAKAVPATEARKEAPPPSQDAKTREGPAPGAALAAAEAAPAAPAPAGSSSPVAAPGAVSTPTNALKRAGGTSAGIVVPAGLGGPPGMPGVVDPAMAAAIAGATSQALARATGMRAAYAPDGSGAIPVGPMGMGVPPPPVRATGMRAAYVPGPDGNPIAVAVPDPSAVMPMGYPGAVPPPPVRATGMRAAYVPGPDGNPMAVAVPDPSVMPGMPYPGAPMPGWPAGVMPGSPYPPQPMDRRHSPPGGYQPLGPGSAHPPHPAWTGGRTQERSAYQIPGMPQSPVAPPPAYPPPPGAPPAAQPQAGQRPAQFGRTVERNVADMKNLPAWAKTGVRKIDPDAMKVPAADTAQKKAHLPEPQAAVPGFDIHERLGKGHVGVVYRATERDTGRIIALKILYPIFLKNPGLAERFKREVKTAVTIDHQNIRKIYGGGEAGGNLYLAMELLDGETMQDKIEKQSQLQEAEALRWVAQIARAMDFYNQKALLHKDVKPENIFITKDNRAALCDMGLSKRTYEDYSLNQQGTTLGSPWYVSPEQGLGNEELDIRSDVYSLGVTLFHCLTGRVPFMGGNAGVIISKHATEAIPDVKKLNANVSRGAVALLERMMAKKREDRHQTPKELMAEIAWLRSESGIAATPIVPLDPPTQEEKDAIVRAQPSFFRRVLRKVGLG